MPEEPIIVEARRKSHPDAAVPVDRLLLEPDDVNIPLLLPPGGEFRVQAFGKNGQVGDTFVIKVPHKD